MKTEMTYLRERFESSTSKRVALDVDRRREQHMSACTNVCVSAVDRITGRQEETETHPWIDTRLREQRQPLERARRQMSSRVRSSTESTRRVYR
jgi:hypothetical protein